MCRIETYSRPAASLYVLLHPRTRLLQNRAHPARSYVSIDVSDGHALAPLARSERDNQ